SLLGPHRGMGGGLSGTWARVRAHIGKRGEGDTSRAPSPFCDSVFAAPFEGPKEYSRPVLIAGLRRLKQHRDSVALGPNAREPVAASAIFANEFLNRTS